MRGSRALRRSGGPSTPSNSSGGWVVIVRDRDRAGRATAWDVAGELRSVAAGVQVVRPAYGKDAFDHLAAGLGVSDFIAEENGELV